MIEVFVKRPATTMMLVLFLVLMGLTAMFSLNIEENPKVDLPMVSVQITYPGASPEEVEVDVIKRVEDAVSEVSGIKKINSQAFENAALIQIEFNIESDVNIKLLEVKDKVEAIQNDFPKIVEKPVISKIDVLSSPVLTIALSSTKHDMKDLYEFADKTLKGSFNSVKGISTVDIIGGDVREIRVYLDSELMKKKFITITDVVSGLSNSNINLAGGEITQRNSSVNIKFFSEFQNMDDIRNVTFTTSEGKIFKLGDIAVVEDSVADRELSGIFSGKDTVILSLKNAPDGNAVEISKDVRAKLPKIESTVLLEGMKLTISNDTSTYISNETADTVKNIIFGMILTVIIILIFTANFSSTIITSLIIPTSIISTMFLMSLSGFTINSMTLLAIASVLGTLIANALIIIESALAVMAQGKTAEQAAIEGTRRVILPVFASSGTNLAVFIPIAFMGGVAGKFMVQFGMTVVYATILSIIISFSLTPMLIAKMIKPGRKGPMERFAEWLNNFLVSNYKTVFDFLWRFKIVSFVIAIVIMGSSLTLVKYLGVEMTPTSDKDELTIVLKTPQGSTIDKTIEKSMKIDDISRKHKEVESVVSTIGTNGVTNSSIKLNLIPLKERPDMSDLALATIILEEISAIPDIQVDIQRGSSEAEITINVYGKEYSKIIEYSKEIEKRMFDLNVFRSVSSSYQEPKNERRFIPNQERLNFYGINNAQIAEAVRASVYGDTTNQYRDKGETYDINVLLNEQSRNNARVFEDIFVSSPKGLLPISQLGSIVEVKSFSDLMRRDKERIIEISGYLGKSSLGKVQQALNSSLDEIKFEEGYGYFYAGNSETSSEVNSELGKAFLLAVILTYMVLAAVLNSYLHPFTIATSIVTSFSGVFVMMFLTDSSINIGSMLAMIMLIGLSVNNSILVVEYAIGLINSGTSVKEALWEGYRDKMRTIFMTSVAIILSMVPQMFVSDLLKSSMGAVIIGGMLGSMLFSFIFTPTVFFVMEKIRTFKFRKKIIQE